MQQTQPRREFLDGTGKFFVEAKKPAVDIRQDDRLVYGLYGQTDEGIRIIEESQRGLL
jgi:hypothetical protein